MVWSDIVWCVTEVKCDENDNGGRHVSGSLNASGSITFPHWDHPLRSFHLNLPAAPEVWSASAPAWKTTSSFHLKIGQEQVQAKVQVRTGTVCLPHAFPHMITLVVPFDPYMYHYVIIMDINGHWTILTNWTTMTIFDISIQILSVQMVEF